MADNNDGNAMSVLNCYTCHVCGHKWEDIWDCDCDDECPECETRDISPTNSYDIESLDDQ